MEQSIYFSDTGGGMTIEEVVEYAIQNKKIYLDWNFNELTGGKSEFVSKETYHEAEAIFLLICQ